MNAARGRATLPKRLVTFITFPLRPSRRRGLRRMPNAPLNAAVLLVSYPRPRRGAATPAPYSARPRKRRQLAEPTASRSASVSPSSSNSSPGVQGRHWKG